MVKVIFILIFLGTVNLFANQINQYKIWVIRHGQRAKITAPAYDPPLTKLGVKQAKKAAHMDAINVDSNYKCSKTNWNCCISSYEFNNKSNCKVKLFFDVSFLLDEEITNNDRYMVKTKK